jgi:hypothetical protein
MRLHVDESGRRFLRSLHGLLERTQHKGRAASLAALSLFSGYFIYALYIHAEAPHGAVKAVMFSYQTFYPGWKGTFRREGDTWREYNKDMPKGRVWQIEPDPPAGRVRLRDGAAVIDIEPATNTIFYTDPARPGYPRPVPLYRIVPN